MRQHVAVYNNLFLNRVSKPLVIWNENELISETKTELKIHRTKKFFFTIILTKQNVPS